MEYDNESHVLNFVSGLVLGAVIGAGIALLTAPDTGRTTRRKLRRAASRLKGGAGDKWESISDDVGKKVEQAMRGARKRFS